MTDRGLGQMGLSGLGYWSDLTYGIPMRSRSPLTSYMVKDTGMEGKWRGISASLPVPVDWTTK